MPIKKTIRQNGNDTNSNLDILYRSNKLYNKTQKNIMSGGKYIDRGGFGCVVSPALACNYKDKPAELDKMVSKILKESTKDVYNELKISSVLNKLDPIRKYYITYLKYCPITQIPDDRPDIVSVHYTNEKHSKYTLAAGQKGKDKKVCDVELSMRPLNIILPFAGYSLSKVMKTPIKSSGTRAIMHRLFIENIKPYFKHLILGLVKMHNNRIVNRDVKQKNIMLNWDKKTNEMQVRYIDFGLSDFLTSDFCGDLSNISSKGTPYYKAPELAVAYYIRKYITTRADQYIIRKITDDLEHHFRRAIMEINEREILGNLQANISAIYAKIKSIWDTKISSAYFGTDKNKFNGYVQKADIYALGLSIFETLYKYSNIPVRNDPQLYDLLIHMIAFDPDKRFNGIQCLAHPYFR